MSKIMIKNKIKKEFPAIAGQFRISFLLIVHCSFLIVNCFTVNCNAEVRYVSKSGSSTPPYTSWETASDSIQKAINICNDGDTIYVANGVYKETLVIDSALTLLGSSMDSTVIDGTGLDGIGGGLNGEGITIKVNNFLNIKNFHIKGKNIEPLTGVISAWDYPFLGKSLLIENANSGIGILKGGKVENSVFKNIHYGISTGSSFNQDTFKIINNILLNDQGNGTGIVNGGGGIHYIYNNILLGLHPSLFTGIDLSLDNYSEVKNNLVANYRFENYDGSNFINKAIIKNNVFLQNNNTNTSSDNVVVLKGKGTEITNNIIAFAKRYGINSENDTTFADYNLFWENGSAVNSSIILGDNNVFADPMFVNDTVGYSFAADYHLQKYSPAIDAGDPNILDVDGTRSDIGLFGGPLGEEYTYQDLAPRNPQNLSAFYDDGVIKLNWNKNTEADLFRYRVYRDTVQNFIYDTTKIIAEISDTLFNDNLKSLNANSYYYKITAIDSSYNQSPASEEITVVITGLGEMPPQIVEDYNLMQNYPNPFNPSTKITYRIKEPGYVKLMVYNLLGEIVEVLVNEFKDKGYYEAEFTSTKANRKGTDGAGEFETMYGHTASGIYLYRIEVIGKGNIPVFSDMKKMMLVK
jgi:type III secretion system FlhB-like substrate exporter